MDKKLHTFKAELVVKGYTRSFEIDHEGTFSPIAEIVSVRMVLVIAAFDDYDKMMFKPLSLIGSYLRRCL